MSCKTTPLAKALASAKVFVDGDWVESKDQDPDGDVRLIQLADVGDGYYVDKSNRFLTSSAAERLKCTFLEPGDVLIARMPDPLGRACIFPGDEKRAVTVVDVCIIRVDPERMYAPWLVHCVNSSITRKQIDGYVTGTTRQRISRGNLGKVGIALPPLPEQRRIAAILDQADALRTKRREALAQLDSLTQSIFIEMFGDPVTNTKHLPTKSLGEISIFENGDRSGNYPSGDDIKNEGILFLSTKNITNGLLDLSRTAYISKQKFASLLRGKAQRNDLIITLRGTLGSCCVFDTEFETAFINAQMMIIRPKPECHHTYLHALLTSKQAQDRFGRIGNGAAVPQLTSTQLAELQIPVPCAADQNEFARRKGALDELREKQNHAMAELDALFASLQHRAFRGEL